MEGTQAHSICNEGGVLFEQLILTINGTIKDIKVNISVGTKTKDKHKIIKKTKTKL
jgi:hypothetical protein